jgi:hypothetical protein
MKMKNFFDKLIHNLKNIDWEKMIYHSGDFFLPKYIRDILNTNIYMSSNYTFYLNGWSVIHFLSGLFIGFIYLIRYYKITKNTINKKDKYYYFIIMLVIHTLWEIWQVIIGMSKPYNLTGDSNIIDTFVDTILFMFGSYFSLILYSILFN